MANQARLCTISGLQWDQHHGSCGESTTACGCRTANSCAKLLETTGLLDQEVRRQPLWVIRESPERQNA
eukprot:4367897-Prorocentrum_lima.AAC.1